MIKVKLSDIVGELETAHEGGYSFLNKISGEIVYLSEEDFELSEQEDIEEDDDIADWQKENIAIAREINDESENYIPLPSEAELNGYKLMEEFCYSLPDESLKNEMLDAIRGKGAFKRFDDKIMHFGIENDWYKFKEDKLRRVAVEWCEKHSIEYI